MIAGPSNPIADASEEGQPSPEDVRLALRELGAWPGNRQLVEEPPADGGLATVAGLDPPAYLNDAAKQIWWRVAPEVFASGRSTPGGLQLLGRYCALMATWISLSEIVAKSGTTYIIRGSPGPDGVAKPTRVRGLPQLEQLLAIGDQLLKLEKELGLA